MRAKYHAPEFPQALVCVQLLSVCVNTAPTLGLCDAFGCDRGQGFARPAGGAKRRQG